MGACGNAKSLKDDGSSVISANSKSKKSEDKKSESNKSDKKSESKKSDKKSEDKKSEEKKSENKEDKNNNKDKPIATRKKKENEKLSTGSNKVLSSQPEESKTKQPQMSYFKKKLMEKSEGTQIEYPFNTKDKTIRISQNEFYYRNNYLQEGKNFLISIGMQENYEGFNNVLQNERKRLSLNDPSLKPNFNNFYQKVRVDQFEEKDALIGISLPNFEDSYAKVDFLPKDLKGFCNMEKKEDPHTFMKTYNNDTLIERIWDNTLRHEIESIDCLKEINIMTNIFSGANMAIASRILEKTNEENLKKCFKIVHLDYKDNFEHPSFTKRKNFIFGISNIYDKCNLVNFVNSPYMAETIAAMTLGERYTLESNFNMSTLLSSLLPDRKANFAYSNGFRVTGNVLKKIDLLFYDCKEGRNHVDYYPQYTSLCIYKGTKNFTGQMREYLNDVMKRIVYNGLTRSTGFYSVVHAPINCGYDFACNIHLSNYFRKVTEEYLNDFWQKFNIDNFDDEESELRKRCIKDADNICGNFKELLKYTI